MTAYTATLCMRDNGKSNHLLSGNVHNVLTIVNIAAKQVIIAGLWPNAFRAHSIRLKNITVVFIRGSVSSSQGFRRWPVKIWRLTIEIVEKYRENTVLMSSIKSLVMLAILTTRVHVIKATIIVLHTPTHARAHARTHSQTFINPCFFEHY